MTTIFSFALGAAVGSVVTWRVLKPKYERLAQEEVDSVKEVYSKKFLELESKEPEEKDWRKEAAERVKNLGYSTFTENAKKIEKEEGPKPYVISPDEFDTIGYVTESLTYYADGIVADDFDAVIDNVEEVIGLESLQHFGDYEDEVVHVRNDETQIDYEVVMDKRNYHDVIASYPTSDNE
jgi:hypothetical protein